MPGAEKQLKLAVMSKEYKVKYGGTSVRDYEAEEQLRQKKRERQRLENRRKARNRQQKKQKMLLTLTGIATVVLLLLVIWLVTVRGGKTGLPEDREETVQGQAPEADTAENETVGSSQDAGQDTGEGEQEMETADAEQPSSMPFAAGYEAKETDNTAYLGSDSVQSSYALLVDLDDNTIVAQKGAYDRISPASMTKILTALVAAEHVTDLDDTFTITKEITDFSYSHDCSAVGFLDEETVTVRDLLYGTILPSGGDAAAGLACYVAGSMDAFVDMMNEKLTELGLSDTAHFTNCVGLYDENHYCSIYDMAMILKAAVENDLAREVLTAHTYTTSATGQHPEGITISNWFLRRIEDKDTKGTVVCAKTGFVAQSGNCAASYEETDSGKHYICVTANAHSSWRCIYDHVAVYQEYTN